MIKSSAGKMKSVLAWNNESADCSILVVMCLSSLHCLVSLYIPISIKIQVPHSSRHDSDAVAFKFALTTDGLTLRRCRHVVCGVTNMLRLLL